ncbi:MAG: ATP-grasp domain-containing protein, partial [Acidobacteriota bacterium]
PEALISFESLVSLHDQEGALKRVLRSHRPRQALYRGWPLSIERYEAFYDALVERRVKLVNKPYQYEICQLLPACYDVLEGNTPTSRWFDHADLDMDAVMAVLAEFAGRPVKVRDHLDANNAQIIPADADRDAVFRLVSHYLMERGDRLTGGLLFREHIELDTLGLDPASGASRRAIWSIVCVDGRPLMVLPCWADVDPTPKDLPMPRFSALASRIDSRFFVMLVARRDDGAWTVLDLMDGQVARLPATTSARAFYSALDEVFRLLPPAASMSGIFPAAKDP